jgi:hypothetical protein
MIDKKKVRPAERRESIIDQIIPFKNRKYFSQKRVWAAKLVGKNERATTLAARREIRKERGHTQQRSDG